jgi:hypothetical protein
MATFDKILPNGVGLFDFTIYASPRAVLAHRNWPARLVPQDDIRDAFEAEAELAKGWLPGEAELADAPKLDDWHIVDYRGRGQGVYLRGTAAGHPTFGGARTFIETSHLVALDTVGHGWARTLSRWYRLGQQT